MKKKLLAGLAAGLFMVGMVGMAEAALWTIGTATYQESATNNAVNPDIGNDQYKLIYDTDLQITWLDYTHGGPNWDAQVAWANTLGGSLTVNMNLLYSTPNDWSTGWRLPATVDGPYTFGYDATTKAGFNITTSEMGHLFYDELGLDAVYTPAAELNTAELNTGEFNNLIASWYWSGTEYADHTVSAWEFIMNYGYQGIELKDWEGYGLAVRSGQVSAVPIPGAVWLLGFGLAGLIGLGRTKNTQENSIYASRQNSMLR